MIVALVFVAIVAALVVALPFVLFSMFVVEAVVEVIGESIPDWLGVSFVVLFLLALAAKLTGAVLA